METFFNIRYEFDRNTVHNRLRKTIQEKRPGYICVADGNILALVHRDADYRRTVDEAMFSICDSSWVPLFLRHLYGIRRSHYCGAQMFRDVVEGSSYRMAFLGGGRKSFAISAPASPPGIPLWRECPSWNSPSVR